MLGVGVGVSKPLLGEFIFREGEGVAVQIGEGAVWVADNGEEGGRRGLLGRGLGGRLSGGGLLGGGLLRRRGLARFPLGGRGGLLRLLGRGRRRGGQGSRVRRTGRGRRDLWLSRGERVSGWRRKAVQRGSRRGSRGGVEAVRQGGLQSVRKGFVESLGE